MPPTLRQLQTFTHVYRLGSLTQAARAMHLTQSAVSLLLQQLEEALGVLLFERTSRSLRPTTAAHEAFEMSQRVLANVDHLVSNARGLADRRRGLLHFGVATSVAATLMPKAIACFEEQYPGIRLVVHDAGPERLISPVLEREVEFSIGTPDRRAAGVDFETLLTDQLAIVCLESNALAGRDRVTWNDLNGVPVISVRPGNGIRSLIDGAMLQAGLEFKPKWEVSFLSTALAMTMQGLGVSVLPGYLIDSFQYAGLVTRNLHEPTVDRSLYLITPQGGCLSPAAAALVDIFKSMAHER